MKFDGCAFDKFILHLKKCGFRYNRQNEDFLPHINDIAITAPLTFYANFEVNARLRLGNMIKFNTVVSMVSLVRVLYEDHVTINLR